MNKLVYVGLSISEISKTLIYEFWYDYVKPKYGKKTTKLCYMDTDSLIVSIKIEDIYSDISKYVGARFGTSNYELNRPMPEGKSNCFNEK